MNALEYLKQEHDLIERELIELESITQDPIINYPNIHHICKKLTELWNNHEEKEEKVFSIFKKEEIRMPVKKMLFEHRDLKKHRDALCSAINSGSEFELKKSLKMHAPVIIKKLRDHINDEDEVLYTISLKLFTPSEIEKMSDYVSS